mmetsp:Transcript_19255/g.46502  ORF Transcript_19255/g.46502 Transcript_19255/m.46502 type:complete len:860 (+) Transcript_19255:74-2653(+)|eukprot:CAMPEP_0180143660 /NCGR_PEP_ID=MMETSP0986-20121125/16397_1 /TAXON_ID=697907 /ORGANISM="non described non described, Strain CCMP2293" /LENGTH=859 /DNA_ID=CAMNT_0022087269 /DNA_START=71 /DNA_END=2650 /DNA_ORIENTATION=+
MPALRGALGALVLPGTARLCNLQVVGAAVRRMSSAGRGEGGQPLGGKQPLTTPTYIVWGAGTDVGKTLVSAALCNYMSRKAKDKKVLFLKPYQTGFPVDSDADTVAAVCGGGTPLFGAHASQLLHASDEVGEFPALVHSEESNSNVETRCEFAWSQAISPHLAVKLEGRPVSDDEILSTISASLTRFAADPHAGLVILETAGAVNSPAPSGRGQADLLRSLRLPGILVGDGRLGGISSTISALESLLMRGYDVSAIVMVDNGMRNDEHVRERVKAEAYACSHGHTIPVIVFPPLPKRRSSNFSASALRSWFLESEQKVKRITDIFLADHKARVEYLATSSEAARRSLWWPFTQHDSVPKVTVIDSRHGEDWMVMEEAGPPALTRLFDGPASWWTQGMTAEQMPAVTRAMAYAAGRYGHVLFPETVSQPALTLAQKLLAGPGQGWATRVFYSDDGSTAVEVAIKMAFRKYMADHGLMDKSEQELAKLNFSILGLSGSYHGDTLGAMDAQSPSVFTGFKQMPWYQPRGVWIDPPTLYLSEGLWQVELPAAISDGHQTSSPISSKEVDVKFSSKADALDMLKRKASPLKTAYLAYINSRLDAAQAKGTQVAACVMESTMHGAGGMDMIDPLFQLAMATVARERRIPVVMDEVFAGLWRLGRLSGCSFSGVVPDIACYAKLLTGGTLPLAATLATEQVFQAFRGPSKTDALLHGHSYTAHPIGCQAGVAALDLMASRDTNPNFVSLGQPLEDHWAEADVLALSHLPQVRRVLALGTLLAVELKDEGGGGYQSKASAVVVAHLRENGVFARPLGNVVYLMVTPSTRQSKCAELMLLLQKSLRTAPAPSGSSPQGGTKSPVVAVP